MNFPVFLTALFLLQFICLVVGSKIAKSIKNQEDYFLAGKGLGFFPLLMTFLATQLGGGMVLGATEEAYQYGWYVLLYPMGSALGFVLLALGLGKKMYQFKVSTIAQIFEIAYRSTSLKKIASGLSILSLFMIFVGQVIASRKFIVSLGFDQNYVYAAFWAIVILYTVMGGLQAVVATDVIQALFFILVFVCSFIFVLNLNAIPLESVVEKGFNSEVFTFDSEKFCGWLLMPLLFMVIEQDMGQRCFAAKSGKVVAWATGCAAVLVLAICLIPIYFGVLGKTSGLVIAADSSVLMTVSTVATTPFLAALMGCAVLAAIISTADSLINAISSNLSQDFNLVRGNRKVLMSRCITTLIALLGIATASFFNNVVDILILSYELSISCLFVSVFVAMIRGRGEKISAILSISCGAIGFVLFRGFPIFLPKEIATLLLSTGGYVLGELIVLWKAKKAAENCVLPE